MLTTSVLSAALSRMPRLLEAAVQGIGKGEFPQSFHRFRDDKQGDDPARQVTDGIEKAVVAVEGDHAADAEERGGGEVVAGEGDAIYEPAHLAMGGEIALGAFGPAAEVKAKPQHEADKTEEHENGGGRTGIIHSAVSPGARVRHSHR